MTAIYYLLIIYAIHGSLSRGKINIFLIGKIHFGKKSAFYIYTSHKSPLATVQIMNAVPQLRQMAKADQKRDKFVRGIISGKTQKQSAIDAGYSPKTAESQASQILKHPKVKAALAKARTKADDSAIIDRNRIIREWNKIAFRNAKTIYNESDEMKQMSELSEEDAACISEVMELQTEIGHSRKVKFFSKEAALKELSKLGGLYPEEGTGEAVKLVFQFGGSNSGNSSS